MSDGSLITSRLGLDITDVIRRKGAAGNTARPAVGEGAGSGDPRTAATPDVIILDDVDVQGLSPASWKAIAERVRKGMGLIMLGGYHSYGPGGFRESPLADVLPIEIGPAQRQGFGEPLREDVQLRGPLHMRPAAPLGVRHPVMQVEGKEIGGGGPATKANENSGPIFGTSCRRWTGRIGLSRKN